VSERIVIDQGFHIDQATGFYYFDKHTMGLRPGELISIAAVKGMGKTTMALNLGVNLAMLNDAPVLFFVPGMSKDDVVTRMMAAEAGVELNRIEQGGGTDADFDKLQQAAKTLSSATIFLDGTLPLTFEHIDSVSRELYQRLFGRPAGSRRAKPAQAAEAEEPAPGSKQLCVVVDGMEHLVQGQEGLIDGTIAKLKNLSRILGASIIVTHSLSNKLEQRVDKRPRVRDLEEWDPLFQHSDLLLLLYRDDHYHADSKLRNIVELIIAKSPLGTSRHPMYFDREYGRFENLTLSDDFTFNLQGQP
jgi:replicative DNA helicase